MKKVIILTTLLIFSISCDSEDDSEKTYSSADDFVGIWNKTSEVQLENKYRNFQINHFTQETCDSEVDGLYGYAQSSDGTVLYETCTDWDASHEATGGYLANLCTDYGLENDVPTTYMGDGVCKTDPITTTNCCSGLQSETLIFRELENSDNVSFHLSGFNSDGVSYEDEGTFFITSETTFTFTDDDGVSTTGTVSALGTTATFTESSGDTDELPSDHHEWGDHNGEINMSGTKTYVYEYVDKEADTSTSN